MKVNPLMASATLGKIQHLLCPHGNVLPFCPPGWSLPHNDVSRVSDDNDAL